MTREDVKELISHHAEAWRYFGEHGIGEGIAQGFSISMENTFDQLLIACDDPEYQGKWNVTL